MGPGQSPGGGSGVGKQFSAFERVLEGSPLQYFVNFLLYYFNPNLKKLHMIAFKFLGIGMPAPTPTTHTHRE